MRCGNSDYVLLQRTLAGIARHVNVGAALLVGLGCESNQISALLDGYRLGDRAGEAWQPPLRCLVIQEQGGIRKAVSAGIELVEALLPVANDVQRTPQPISELMLAVQCGGSDSWSGVTANPLVGLVSDAIVQQGGTVVLAETPEIYGAEHLLAQRAISPEVRARLLGKVRWWEEHTRQLGLEIDNNPSPGNRAGGLTTIYEKSLGAIAKGGSTPLVAVYDYAEPVTARGLTFMDSPGYDPVSVTGQMAGGCNLVLFTTGRGSVFGGKPAPAIKVCSNSRTFQRMADDMDFNAGVSLEGAEMPAAAAGLLNLALSVASGQPSVSEAQGVGEAEFNPWNLGGIL
jgi:altronate hydrolase